MLFKIELAKLSDMIDLYKLANDKVVRRNSFNQEAIALEDHKKWFKEKLWDKNSYFYVVRQNNEFIGSIRYDRKEDDIFIVGVQIVEKYRGKGLATKIIALSAEQLFSIVGKDIKIIAYIKRENKSSAKAFASANYKLVNEIQFKGFATYIFEYQKK